MANIAEQIKTNERLAKIFQDLHLISLLALACFFVFEKRWPGLISNYIHPAVLIVFWLIAIYFNAVSAKVKWTVIQVLAGVGLIVLIFSFYIKSLGPWYWMIIFISPLILLIISHFRKRD